MLFVNAEKLFKRGRNQNTLEPEHAGKICKPIEAFTDEPGFAHVADLAEIASNDYNLNISLYVAAADDGDELTLEQALADLEQAQASAPSNPAGVGSRTCRLGVAVSPRPSTSAHGSASGNWSPTCGARRCCCAA